MGSRPFAEGAPALARAGFQVFRIRPGSKRPMDKWGLGTEHQRATTNLAEVERRARLTPSANVGIATGTLADDTPFAVLDLDPKHGGTRPSWAIPTREAATPSGGRHCYYLTDGIVRNSAGRIAPGVDVRGARGIVVAPPSLTEVGGYEWATDPEQPMAFVPATQFHEFTVSPDGTGTHLAAVRKRPEDVRLGEVHNQLMSWAAWLAGRGHAEDAVDEFLREFVARIPEPLDAADTLDDIEKCVGWVYEREAAAA